MKILNWSWRNYKSYGDVKQTMSFAPDKGELILLIGENGAGKCVEKNTFIDININDIELNSNIIDYLLKTEKGNKILLHIKENNIKLYNEIQNYKKMR